uniref:Xylose isomerase n=1 Tax=Zea mays TaxID=4577 RepID=A0A804MNX8_MAIZE
MPAYFHCKRVLRAPRLHQSRSGAPSQLGKLSSPPRRSHSPPRPPFPTHRRPLRLLSSPPDPAWRTPEGDHTLPPSPPWPPDLARHTRAPAWRSPGDEAQHPVKLLLGDGVEVLDISLPDRTVRIQTKISWVEYAAEFNGSWSVPAPDGPLMVSTARNSFVAFGCNVLAKLIPYGTVLSYASTCAAACMNTPDVSSCSGVRCCQTSIASLGSDLPCPEVKVYAYSAAQVKKALEVTHYLGGENYVFWGGREGYQSLLNTDMNRELDHLLTFFKLMLTTRRRLDSTN